MKRIVLGVFLTLLALVLLVGLARTEDIDVIVVRETTTQWKASISLVQFGDSASWNIRILDKKVLPDTLTYRLVVGKERKVLEGEMGKIILNLGVNRIIEKIKAGKIERR